MFNFHCNYIATLKAKYFSGCLVSISVRAVVDYCFMGCGLYEQETVLPGEY